MEKRNIWHRCEFTSHSPHLKGFRKKILVHPSSETCSSNKNIYLPPQGVREKTQKMHTRNVRNLMRSNWIDESVSARVCCWNTGRIPNRNHLLLPRSFSSSLLMLLHSFGFFKNYYCCLTCDRDVNYDGQVMLSIWNQFVSRFLSFIQLPQRQTSNTSVW